MKEMRGNLQFKIKRNTNFTLKNPSEYVLNSQICGYVGKNSSLQWSYHFLLHIFATYKTLWNGKFSTTNSSPTHPLSCERALMFCFVPIKQRVEIQFESHFSLISAWTHQVALGCNMGIVIRKAQSCHMQPLTTVEQSHNILGELSQEAPHQSADLPGPIRAGKAVVKVNKAYINFSGSMPHCRTYFWVHTQRGYSDINNTMCLLPGVCALVKVSRAKQ